MTFFENDVLRGAMALHALNEARLWPNTADMRISWENLSPVTHAHYMAQSRAVLSCTAQYITDRGGVMGMRRAAMRARSMASSAGHVDAAAAFNRAANAIEIDADETERWIPL